MHYMFGSRTILFIMLIYGTWFHNVSCWAAILCIIIIIEQMAEDRPVAAYQWLMFITLLQHYYNHIT